VKLEELHIYSSSGPIMIYWQSELLKKSFISNLSSSLLKYRSLTLVDTAQFPINDIFNTNTAFTITPSFSDKDTSLLHLYVDIYELPPASYFLNSKKGSEDSNIYKKSKTIFLISVSIVNSKKRVINQETLHISAYNAETIGMGLKYEFNGTFLVTTLSGFNAMLKKGLDIMLNPSSDAELVEMMLPTAFALDNFILPFAANKARTPVITVKNISQFNYAGSQQMIRKGEKQYEEIRLKGKNALTYPRDLTAAIKKTYDYEKSDYVFLRQEGRDIIKDRNYLLKLTVQIDPFFRPANPDLLFTNFLAGPFHFLLNDKDTIASFEIKKEVRTNNGEKLFFNTVYNGLDSSSIYTMDNLSREWPAVFNYVIKGIINKQPFVIEIIGSYLKKIYLNEKLVCIIDGHFVIDKMVILDQSIEPELMNQLLLIATNNFLE
jgi:hypothetical protein